MKIRTTRLALLAALTLGTVGAQAQSAQSFIGTRVYVESPVSLMGFEPNFDVTNDCSGETTEWGGCIATPYINRLVVIADDSLGCTSLNNASEVAGNWVLIKRGNCEFGAKALNAQLAGAEGVFIYNNAAGAGAPNMGPGANGSSVTIPVIGLPYEVGNAWKQSALQGSDVYVTITPWGMGATNDLAFVKGSSAYYHAGAIPLNQLMAGAAEDAYKDYMGGFIANTGTADATNVLLTHSVVFTPQGGGPASTLVSDTFGVNSFPTIDSVYRLTNTTNGYELNVTNKGVMTFNYGLFSDAETQLTDNEESFDVYVTDSVFCKSQWDNANGHPKANSYYKFASGSMMTGPFYYVAEGGHLAKKVQFSVSSNTDSLDVVGSASVYIFKYESVDGDPFAQTEELELVGTGIRSFTTADHSQDWFTVDIQDPGGSSDPVVLDAGTWYWVAVDGGEKLFVGLDNTQQQSYYQRVNASQFITGVPEPFSGQLNTPFPPVAGDTVRMFPFFAASAADSAIGVRFTDTRGYIPSIALHTSKLASGSVGTVSSTGLGLSLYPNPATTSITFEVNGIKEPGKQGYVRVLDGLGRVVVRENMTYNGTPLTLSTAGLAPGNYWFVYHQGGQISTHKFTIVK